MLKKRGFGVFVICSALLGGIVSFFVYNTIFSNYIMSIIIGIFVTLFIFAMEILFAIKLLDEMYYQLERNRVLQSLEKRRSRLRWYNYILWWTNQKR